MRLNVLLHGEPVGQLLPKNGSNFFEYDPQFIQRGLRISPFTLPLQTAPSKHSNAVFHTLPGVLSDSLPDHFGMQVMRRNFDAAPTPLQMLAYQGSKTMGALTYEPAMAEPESAQEIDLVSAAQSARNVLEHQHEATLDASILNAGHTAGGMMPKVLAAISPDCSKVVTGADQIPDGMQPWLIKLNEARIEHSSRCHLEMAYFELARMAGIRVPETRMIRDSGGIPHFAIRRFDRKADDPNARIHLHTFSGLMEIDMADASQDYDTLLRVTSRLTGKSSEVEEQFKRMVFNLLACVRDDHAKNFSFLMADNGEWSISPAYDLSFADNKIGGNWLALNGKRRGITQSHLQQMAKPFGLSKGIVGSIIDQVRAALGNWQAIAEEHDIGAGRSTVIAKEHAQMLTELDG